VVGILRGIVADGVEVGEVVADGGEGLLLILPALREIRFAAGGFAHALEDGGRDGLGFGLLGTDHVDDGAGGLSEFGDVFRGNEAGVVGAVGEYDDGFASGEGGRRLLPS